MPKGTTFHNVKVVKSSEMNSTLANINKASEPGDFKDSSFPPADKTGLYPLLAGREEYDTGARWHKGMVDTDRFWYDLDLDLVKGSTYCAKQNKPWYLYPGTWGISIVVDVTPKEGVRQIAYSYVYIMLKITKGPGRVVIAGWNAISEPNRGRKPGVRGRRRNRVQNI